uniref:ABC-type xenobiotic transporter n=1 Tax=Fagus sylvatica TaxID=28930 RepID=A0A2N9FHF0_FAGSY
MLICSAIYNGGLSLAYLGLGICIIGENLNAKRAILPSHGWLVLLFQGFTWMLLDIAVIIERPRLLHVTTTQLCSIATLFSGILCFSSPWVAIVDKKASINMVLNILSFPGAIMLLLCASQEHKYVETDLQISHYALNPSLKGEEASDIVENCSNDNVTPFSKAGFLSKMSFWWLNPLMKHGKDKILKEDEIPQLRQEDRAQACYLMFKEQLSKRKQKGTYDMPSMVLTASTGPLFLKAFIKVAEGKETFKYEGYTLAGMLFLVKSIYQKQLKLSNAAKVTHSPGQIMNYVTVDAYRIGLATFAALFVIILTVLATSPVAKLQHKYQTKLMVAQDKRLKAITEALANMKVLKLYAWEKHFKNVIQVLRKEEQEWILAVLLQKGYYLILFWSSPILVSVATFGACYFFGVPLSASNVFTFLASLRIVQEPIRIIPDVAGVFIEAKVSLTRILKFLEAPELQDRYAMQKCNDKELEQSILIKATEISWETNSAKAVLRNINLAVKPGEKVAICGEVGSGKSTLLAAILGEVPNIKGIVHVYGKRAYVSQTAWIQTGSIQENILFGSPMDSHRYQEVLRKCSLIKDLEMLPVGDQTEIGERGVTLSGGQKQRVQLARALYQDADVYLLDDPFSAVDAHTATSLFNEYVMEALSGKTVLLVTHQVDFLPAFDSILLIMSEGHVLKASTYDQLLASSQEFQNLVNAHNDTVGSQKHAKNASLQQSKTSTGEILKIGEEQLRLSIDQLIKKEERETGYTGLKPYIQYLSQSKGFLYFFLAAICHFIFLAGQLIQNYWLAAEIEVSSVSRVRLIAVYSGIGSIMVLFLLLRAISVVSLGFGASLSIFSTLLSSLFRAPMSFYDATPLGRILSRVASDMSVIDIDVACRLSIVLVSTMTAYSTYVILAILTWPVLFVIIPMVYLTVLLQRYYLASAKELMRTDGTTKSSLASHLAESIAGAMTIRAFGEEERYFSKNLELIDTNASPYFHGFSASEWLIQRLEIICAIVLSSLALATTLLHLGASASERLEQYMRIPSEAAEVVDGHQPTHNWPVVGQVKICDLKVRYRPNAPPVLQGISCIFEGGHKIGIVGRTGSGKTTLISALFRLVEPTEGKIIIDDIDISTIGLHDLRSRLGIIPQDPTLFSGSVRYNLDPLSKHTDQEMWEVLEKCQLREAIRKKEEGLDSLVTQDGSNWSMGQRQLFCLGRALLKRSRILVLDEATASIDNVTDSILQKTIRKEFACCTVINCRLIEYQL